MKHNNLTMGTFIRVSQKTKSLFNDDTILDIYNLLIEFDRNKHTSNFKEFVKNYNEYKYGYK